MSENKFDRRPAKSIISLGGNLRKYGARRGKGKNDINKDAWAWEAQAREKANHP